MIRGVNKVILIGIVGQTPVVRFTPKGEAIANISLATSEKWKDQQSFQQERTEWHRIVIFGKPAEIAQLYVHKGSKLFIEGKLQTRKWQDNNGQNRYNTEIIINNFNGQMQILDRLNDQPAAYNQQRSNQQDPATPPPPQAEQPQQSENQNAPNEQPSQPALPTGRFDNFTSRYLSNSELP